jgi:hypothetical protein
MPKMPKRKRMAVGGKPGESAMARAEASRSTSPRNGGFAGAGRSAGGGGGKSDPMVRNDFRQVPMGALPGKGGVAGDARPGFRGQMKSPQPMGNKKSEGNYPTVNRSGKGNPQGSVTGKDPARLKKGGMVKNKMKKGK